MTQQPTFPLAQPIGVSPQVDTLIILAGTIQELRGSVPPVRGGQVVTARSQVCQEAASEGHPGPHTSPKSTVWTEGPEAPLPSRRVGACLLLGPAWELVLPTWWPPGACRDGCHLGKRPGQGQSPLS